MDAKAWDARYAETELMWSVEPNQFVANECADLRPGRALDLACGEGRNAIWLARQGWDVTASDFSAVALEKARRLAGDLTLEWVVADATTWEPDGPYDLAVLAYLQLPADERRAAVRHAFAALGPGWHVPAGRPRHRQPDRRHRGAPGRGRPDDGRRRARRPGRPGPSRSSGPSG